jgi:pimeloyl-ACP methyl ester carboxylesterase
MNERGWRSDAAERRFRALEDELLASRWPDGIDTVEVETTWGRTHVYRWPGEGTPIVFLHGMGGTGATFPQYVERLRGRAMYGIDTLGDVGRSVPAPGTRIVTRDDLAGWLDETLAGLGVERAHLVGTSYGGMLALNLAIRRPERIASTTLIDPGALAPFQLVRFMLWGVPMLLGFLLPGPIRRRLARKRPLLEDARLLRLGFHGQRNHPFKMPGPDPFTNDELRSVTVPTTVILAGRSAAFSATIAAEHARLIPGAVVDVVEGAGHEVSWSHVDRCIAPLLEAPV